MFGGSLERLLGDVWGEVGEFLGNGVGNQIGTRVGKSLGHFCFQKKKLKKRKGAWRITNARIELKRREDALLNIALFFPNPLEGADSGASASTNWARGTLESA